MWKSKGVGRRRSKEKEENENPVFKRTLYEGCCNIGILFQVRGSEGGRRKEEEEEESF